MEIGVATPTAILAAVAKNPGVTQKELARLTGVTPRTISRVFRQLRDAGVIRRIGSDRHGHWQIIRKDP